MLPTTYEKPSKAEQDIHWAKIWFRKLAAFHDRKAQHRWDFTTDDVIAFLKSKRDSRVPAWKRMKILQGLLIHRSMI